MNLTEINNLTPDCCAAAKIDINDCYKNEKRPLKNISAAVKSIIVVAHHIENSQEWIWTQMRSERGNSTCIADLHTRDTIRDIKDYLKLEGFNTKIVPYPGVSGIRFKELANKTSLGEIGDNNLFLHKEWGPWVHLRVLLTDAEIYNSEPTYSSEVCIHCGKCIEACPVNALSQNDFNIQRCKERHKKLNSAHSCEICARICPIGEEPPKIE